MYLEIILFLRILWYKTQVDGTPHIADDEPIVRKAKISIVIDEERYELNYLTVEASMGACIN